jgi:hypothetical protein
MYTEEVKVESVPPSSCNFILAWSASPLHFVALFSDTREFHLNGSIHFCVRKWTSCILRNTCFARPGSFCALSAL